MAAIPAPVPGNEEEVVVVILSRATLTASQSSMDTADATGPPCPSDPMARVLGAASASWASLAVPVKWNGRTSAARPCAPTW